jgi:hypothetical protein
MNKYLKSIADFQQISVEKSAMQNSRTWYKNEAFQQ